MYEEMLKNLTQGALAEKIDAANALAVNRLIDADPVWEDVRPAGEVLEGMEDCIVVEREGRVLICRLSEEQRIKDFQK